MQPTDIKIYWRKRYLMTGLSFIGNMVLFILRVNLSICLVEITSKKTIFVGNETFTEKPEYNWSPSERALVLSSFSWGFVISPLTIVLVNKFGPAHMYGFSIFSTGLLTAISPILIRSGIHFYVIARFLEGIAEGLGIASICGVCTNWIPSKERSRLVNFSTLGCSFGIIVGYPLSGYISHKLNWESVFYITGGMAIAWSLLWGLTIGNSPSTDLFITKQEKLYLQNVIKPVSRKNEIHQWKSMLKSVPVLAYLNEVFVESWSFSFLTYFLPIFIKDMHDMSMDQIGIYSSLPHICNICARLLGCWFQDYLRAKNPTSKTFIHKTYIAFGQVSAICLFLLTGFWNNFYGLMIIFCVYRICFGMAEVSYWVLPFEMAPHQSAAIQSLKGTSVSIGYFLNPIIMSFMVSNHTYDEWRHYFWFLCIFNLWGLVIFARFGSAELQSWASSDEERANLPVKKNEISP